MSNKINLFIFLIYTTALTVSGQDMINTYSLPSSFLTADYQYPPTSGYSASNPNGFLFTPWARSNISSGSYIGEYQIALDRHPWFIQSPFSGYAKTCKTEVVSFPFTVNCWDQTGCTYSITGSNSTRTLVMPNDSYNSGTNKWGDLNRFYEEEFGNLSSFVTEASTLVSYAFLAASSMYNQRPSNFPHTALKHTIELHCSSDPNDDIIASFSFIYDNTRGRMKYYPFKNNNDAQGAGSSMYDVVYRPENLIDPDRTYGYQYNDSSNSGWFDGGTINYFPYSEINPQCGLPALIPSNSDYFVGSANFTQNPNNTYEWLASAYDYTFHPPYSLTSTFLRDNSALYPAGYEYNSVTQALAERPGIPHTYQIDADIDLSDINPTEKVIYNPSEVDVTYAGQIIFPDNYTFKTIRGKYPTSAEVNAANTTANCGTYTDLRDVPVPTDVSSTADPNDASVYHVENGSTIVINTCVKIFDATFDIKSGGTLQYLNRSTNCGRWKVQNNGTVIENSSDEIYLQKKTINQGRYEYESKNVIESGYNVDANQPSGNYVVTTGGDVSLISEDGILLKDGFWVDAGGVFYANITSSVNAPFCNARLSNQSSQGTPKHYQTNVENTISSKPTLLVSPNPCNGVSSAILNEPNKREKSVYYITIFNIMGEEVLHLSNLDSQSNHNLDLSPFPKGIYFIKAQNDEGIYTEKIIVN